MYYIISLKHTCREDAYMTLWRANNSGYAYSQESAGKYETARDMGCDSIFIKVDELDPFFIPNGEGLKCVPNCRQVWEFFNLKMTKRGLVQTTPKNSQQ